MLGKVKFGLLGLIFSACFFAESVLAQDADFSPADNMFAPDALAPHDGQNFMSDDDMSFGSDNDVDFASTTAPVPMVQSGQQKFQADNANPPPQNKMQLGTPPQADTLTDTLQQQNQQHLSNINLPNVSGTWVDQLASSVPQAISSSLNKDNQSGGDETMQNLMNDSRESSQRSNASVFDISGIMLRMNLDQAEKAMMVRGFKKISQKMEIPNFIKWRNEETCRNNGVVGYERLMNCVVEIAKKNNYQYVETAKYTKYSTKEEIEIKLTSNFTGNKIYRIQYKSMSGKVIGSGAKAAYLRNIKVYDFWKKVNQKYGAPDNKDEVTWGLGMNKPYMKASTGFLLLEDPMLRELDYTRMSREDQRFMNTDLYSF